MNDLEAEMELRAEVVKFSIRWMMAEHARWQISLAVKRLHARTFVKKIEHWNRPCPSGTLPHNVRIALRKRIRQQKLSRQRDLIRYCEIQRYERFISREDD